MANENNHGGARSGAGRKPLLDSEKRLKHMRNALKQHYKVESTDLAITKFIQDNLDDDKCRLWFMKQILGEVSTSVDVTSGGETIKITLKD